MVRDKIEKWRDASPALKAAVWFVICSILQKGIQFITVPIFTRIMSTEQYGQYTLYQTWYSVVTIFATFNLAGGVFNNGMTKYENDRDGFTASIQGLSTVLTLVVAFVYLLNVSFWNNIFKLPTMVMVSMFAELIFYTALSYWTVRQRYEFKYKAVVITTIVLSVLNPAVGLFAVRISEDKGVARIMSAIILNILVGLLFYIYNIIKGKRLFNKEYWTFAFKFNLPLVPHYLSFVVLGQCDRIMIEKMFGVEKVAIYSVAATISMIMSIIVTSVNSSYTPWVYQECKKENYARIAGCTSYLLVGMAFISLIPVLVAPEVLRFIAPVQYFEAVWVIPPITTGVFFTFLYSVFGNIEFYYEENIFVMIASVISAVVNILLNYMFMSIFGYLAAGYTTMICYIIMAVAHYFFMRKVCKKNNVQKKIFDYKSICIISITYLCVTGFMMLLFDYMCIRLIIIVVVCCVAFIKRNSILKVILGMKREGN